MATTRFWPLVLLLVIEGCRAGYGSGSGLGPDAAFDAAHPRDGSKRPEASVDNDASVPDSKVGSDAGDGSTDPCVVELPPSGQNEICGFTNAGHIVTYAEYRGDPAKYLDVYYYHLLDLVEHAVTDRELGQVIPDVHGDEIIFEDDRFYDAQTQNYQTELYLYDIATATETRLTDSPFIKFYPNLNQEWFLYRSTEGCADIYHDQLHLMNRQTQEVTVLSECNQFAETISMSDRYAAWSGRPLAGSYKVVFVRDLQAGVTLDIGSTAPTSQFFPHAEGDHAIWQDYRDGRREIYMYTFSTGQEECLTPDPWEQAWPYLRNGIASWSDYRFSQDWGEYGLCDIYVHEIATGIGRRVTSESKAWRPRFVDSGWILYGLRITSGQFKLYGHDLVCAGILTADGHVIP